ncbi:MAG: ribosome small subunit-dependent GTPase A [Gemmatimonadota bacterium]
MTVERGLVHGSEGGVYQVVLDSGEQVDASLRGRVKREARVGDRVVIGDSVDVRRDADGSVTIEAVHPRRTQVIRRGPGGRRAKVVAANVDRLVAVVAARRPAPRQALIDRLLVVGEVNRLEIVLVVNKQDLLAGAEGGEGAGEKGAEELRALVELYRDLGYPVLETSARDGRGMESLRGFLCRGISALVGPSGAGKSTLLNAIQPGLSLRTGGVSLKAGRGRHTTVSARLLTLACGGVVADTPGFSDVGVWGVEARELEGCFPEFSLYREGCRFRGCTHLHEPGCRVRGALEEGVIDPGRYESYRILFQEAQEADRRLFR